MLRPPLPWVLAGVVIGLFLVSAGCSDEAPPPPAVPPDLPQLQLNDIPEAARADIESALSLAERQPTEALPSGQLGMILHAYKQYESAATCYERAVAMAPDEFRWAYLLGTVRFLLGRDQDAVEPLRRALDLDPSYLPARIKLAQVLSSLGNDPASETEYRAAITQDPKSALPYYGLGRLIAARDGNEAAIEYYRTACELSPTFGAAQYALSQAYRATGNNTQADTHLAMFEKYKTAGEPLEDPLLHEISQLARSPANEHYTQGLALVDAGDLEGAVKEFEQAVAADPNLIEARVNLVSVYGGLGREADVERHYAAAAKSHPNRADLHYNYGVFQADHDHLAEAEAAFRRAIEADPAMAEAHSVLGQTLEAQQRVGEAEKHYRRAVAIQPAFRLAQFHLGRILLGQGRTEEGIEHFLNTLTPEDEETPRYMLDVAVAYARAGDIPSARRYTLQARERSLQLKQTEVVSMANQILEKLGEESR